MLNSIRTAALPGCLVVAAVLTACNRSDGSRAPRPTIVVAGANIERGKAIVVSHNCTACHAIADIDGANGQAGPPLTGFANRALIAGELANKPDNLIRWIMNPSAVEAHTVMPDMGLTPDEARDVAGYLYTLK